MASRIIYFDLADRPWVEALGLTTVGKALSFQGGRIATINRSSDALEIPAAHAGGPSAIFLKRYRSRRWLSRWKQMFRGSFFGKSRARFEFEVLREMQKRGIPAVRPIAFGEKRKTGFVHASYLITEGVPEAESLDGYALRSDGAMTLPMKDRRQAVHELARLFRQTHQAGVMHGGLFWRNVLVCSPADNGAAFVLLDPDPAGRVSAGPLSRRHAAADLARFLATAGAILSLRKDDDSLPCVFSRTDLLRFARGYLDTPRLQQQHKQWLRECLRLAGPFVQQEQHRLAMGSLIKRVRANVEDGRRTDGAALGNSIDSFLDHLGNRKIPKLLFRGKRRVVHFTFHNVDAGNGALLATLAIDGGLFHVTRGEHSGTPDLALACDGDVWVAILRGQADAFDLIRAREIEIRGNTALLAGLARLLGF